VLEKRWIRQEASPSVTEALCSEMGISLTAARVLANRGIISREDADIFLRSSLEDLNEPFHLPDMDIAVRRIIRAIRSDEVIFIYGDYDADGITATSLLVKFFHDIGKKVEYYIPKRLGDGYGISVGALKKIKAAGASLVVTVDCGISSVLEMDAAKAMGLDVVITDHHEPPETLPKALAVVNPRLRGCGYPFKGLAGVGIALKLAQAVKAGFNGKDKAGPGIDEDLRKYLDLVALGTVADVVPLRGENRILVKHGLQLLKDSSRVGIKKLKEVALIKDEYFSAGTVGFQMAPRLNASGRLGEAEAGVRLLLTEDPDEAAAIASNLDALNRERQEIEEKILDDARSMIVCDPDYGYSSIVLHSREWHQGVIGIVASKLVEEFYRPTVLISMVDGIGKGSARGIPGFNLYHGLDKCREHLEAYGGHKFAAGLSIKKENLEAFRERFEATVKEALSPEDYIPWLRIDDDVALKNLDWKVYSEIKAMAPFGPANPEPVLTGGPLQVMYPKIVGRNHVRMKLVQDGYFLNSIAFNMGNSYQGLAMKKVFVNAAFSLSASEWQGEKSLQLNVKDLHFRRC
jgi:single-stranded-DNA-specific exonuclease